MIFGIVYAEIAIEDALLNYNIISLSTYEIINYISMFFWPSILGFFSNKLYILKSKKDVSKILIEKSNSDQVMELVSKKGGTNHLSRAPGCSSPDRSPGRRG